MGTLVTADGGFDLQKQAGGGRKIGAGVAVPARPVPAAPPSPRPARDPARPAREPRDLLSLPEDLARRSEGLGSSGRLRHFINAMLISWKATH